VQRGEIKKGVFRPEPHRSVFGLGLIVPKGLRAFSKSIVPLKEKEVVVLNIAEFIFHRQ
jgi:hypothetical protein